MQIADAAALQPLDHAPELSADEAELLRQAEEAREEQEKLRRRIVEGLGHRLRSEFQRRQSARREVEERWHQDLRQYNGQYEPKFLEQLTERQYGSRVFVPITRRICNLVEARVTDLLFPTDDRNFVIDSSPVPELADAEKLARQLPPDQPVDAGGQPVPADAVALGIRELREEAQNRAAGMQRAVDDQLKECNYPGEARRVIRDAIKIGTGVLKGPSVFGRTKKKWTVKDGVSVLSIAEDLTAAAVRVDPWQVYPDLAVTNVADTDWYELHRMTKAKLAKLARQPGFDREAIERVIEAGAQATRDGNLDQRREAAGTAGVDDKRFNLVEYTGSVDCEELEAFGLEFPEGHDKLASYSAVVWFSEFTGEVVKAILSPLDTDEAPYSVFNWQTDDACLFGYGLPYELRDMQESANSSFRAMLDNMGLCVGPLVVHNSKKVRPVNGRNTIEPNKVYDLTDSSVPVSNVFGFYQIDSRVQELLAVFNTAKGMADEIGGPMLAMQGQEAASWAQAGATGASIAYNAASIWMRRAVRLWDDQVTVPMIGRFVDWNMQYNPDDKIKGDVHVVARGTSALLEAEGQAQRVQMLAQVSQQMGIPLRKAINQLRAMARAMRLDPDDLLPDDEEIKAMEAQQQQAGPPPNPEMERITLRREEIAARDKEREFQLLVENGRNEIRLAEIASRENLTMQQAREKYGIEELKVQAELQDRREQRAHDAQALNAEIAVKAQAGSGI